MSSNTLSFLLLNKIYKSENDHSFKEKILQLSKHATVVLNIGEYDVEDTEQFLIDTSNHELCIHLPLQFFKPDHSHVYVAGYIDDDLIERCFKIGGSPMKRFILSHSKLIDISVDELSGIYTKSNLLEAEENRRPYLGNIYRHEHDPYQYES